MQLSAYHHLSDGNYIKNRIVLCGSDNLIPEIPNTGHRCSHNHLVTTWFRSVWPCNSIPVPKNIYFVGSWSTLSMAMELLLLRLNWWYFVLY